ncbi:hypothetical protein LGH70_20620 [Hymenobacter sp. BT635]|uniref:CBM-cenC domain-containing protein n=1 Tax=Hymenobacter nitidus TaxID=2880929 RepID=A0ABS8AHU6_9BACT|nr:carbohydrate binding domain-containing protein [Hymenobacter nitidus]MCB2380010.1 hypothetical protein [Hymenobacter nitidus]
MRSSSFCLVLLLFAAACSQKKNEQADDTKGKALLSTSYENLEGWVPENASLTKEKAHTGNYSVKVDPAIEFGLTYVNKLGRLSPTRSNKLRLKAWYMLTKPGKASLVFQIVNPDNTSTNAFYEKISLEKVGDWTEVSQVLTLPPVIDPASEVRVYLWRDEATGASYLDDVELTVEP